MQITDRSYNGGVSAGMAVLVVDLVWPRNCKIGYGLKKAGWYVVLLHKSPLTVSKPSDCFDEIHVYSSPQQACELATQFRPDVFHVFAHWNYETAACLIRSGIKPIVFDDYDILSGVARKDFLEKNYSGQMELERYCMENAAGICCRDLLLRKAKYDLKYRINGRIIYFPDYCWDMPYSPLPPRKNQDGGLHIVYAGGITIEKRSPPDSHRTGFYFLEFARKLASRGIHFHMYPVPLTDIEQNYEHVFSEHLELSKQTPFFHMNRPLPADRLISELSAFDLGLLSIWRGMEYTNPAYEPVIFSHSDSNKLYDYVDAGLGIITCDSLRLQRHYLGRKHICISAYLDDVAEVIDTTPPEFWLTRKSNVQQARSSFSIRRHVTRLTAFYHDIAFSAPRRFYSFFSLQQGANGTDMGQAPEGKEMQHGTKPSITLETIDNRLADMISSLKTNQFPLRELNWDSITNLSKKCLYAGDIPDRQEYEGLIGLSLNRHDSRHILHDINFPLPLADNSVDSYQAEDVFEHIPYSKLVPIINDIFRVLKPGGTFRLSIPDYGCDVLQERSIKDASGNMVFDPCGGGTPESPGHVWFPRIDNLRPLLQKTAFASYGEIEYLHYWDTDKSFVTRPIDYSKGHIQRTPDFDPRVQTPYRPMSLVVDLTKGVSETMPQNFHATAETTPASNTKLVKISFVMIVLNGMPFIEYALKAIYDEAHEIIIVEGAVEKCSFAANPDGSSIDGTVECIRSFPDPYRKIRLIQGRWPEKCEMQNAALSHVSGNYVWLVDSDEIYKRGDIGKIRSLLAGDPAITQANFIPDNFWKGFDYLFVSPHFFEPANHYRRLFKFKPGSHFTTHRPPTMVWPGLDISTEQMKLLDGATTRKMGIYPYHYSYVLESQVQQKIELYRRYGWGDGWKIDLEKWYREFFQQWTPENSRELEGLYPIWTGDRHSCSEPFTGTHPEVMGELISAYRTGGITERTDWRTRLYDRLRPPSLIPPEYINVYLNLASRSLTVPGDILEVGVYRGGSLFRLAEHLEKNHLAAMSHKRLIGIDTFQGHPHSEPGVDPANHPKGRFSDTSYQDVKRALSLFPFVDVLMGDCAEIFTSFPAEQKFCLVNIDVDVKKSAVDALNFIYPRLAVGGAIIFDEFEGYGQEGYIKDFFRDKPVEMKPRTGRPGQDYGLIVIKRAENKIATLSAPPDEQNALVKAGAAKCNLSKRFRIAGEGVVGSDLTQIQEGSGFEASLRELVLSIKPRTIIETGTYLGNGTTRIIATALRDAGLIGTTFYSIECNSVHHRQACFNLDQAGLLPFVKPLHGLSVPRNLLPSVENIFDDTMRNEVEDDIFVDHQEQNRVALYYRETDFPDIPDDLIGACLAQFEGRPDLVLLDSAGHMGSVEFNYVVERLQGECYVVLDDIRHVKHYRSFKLLQEDPRFTVITSSDEKFGFCIARFNPGEKGESTIRRSSILWVRPDSIGDNILAMAMLPHLKARRPDAAIVAFCQEHIAELYEACPAVDRVITFNRMRAFQDESYRTAILGQLQELRADICLNSLFSRDLLADFFAARSGAQERIALMGDLSNTSAEDRDAYNQLYTSILTSTGEHKLEIDRHQDFLRGIGVTGELLKPSLWLLPGDIAFSDRFFKERGFEPEKTIALFAGAQFGVRFYDKYGEGLAAFCRENGFSVVALGSAGDYDINQYNLDAIGVTTANLSGATTLRQGAAILSRCRLAVGAETGLAHMACAVGTPNVIVLGGGHFGRFIPYSPLTSVVCLPLECYGCNWRCRYERAHCVRDVSPTVIAEALRHSLAGKPDRIRYFVQGDSLWEPKAGGPTRELSTRFMLVEGELITVDNR